MSCESGVLTNISDIGSVAARIQSLIGPVAARSVFAIWQSARMGGYGVAQVNGGVRALVALADAAVAQCNLLEDCKGLISGGLPTMKMEGATAVLAVIAGIGSTVGLTW